jgi:hypothetical protein
MKKLKKIEVFQRWKFSGLIPLDSWDKRYKTFYVCTLRMFVIWSWQAFPAYSNVLGGASLW